MGGGCDVSECGHCAGVDAVQCALACFDAGDLAYGAAGDVESVLQCRLHLVLDHFVESGSEAVEAGVGIVAAGTAGHLYDAEHRHRAGGYRFHRRAGADAAVPGSLWSAGGTVWGDPGEYAGVAVGAGQGGAAELLHRAGIVFHAGEFCAVAASAGVVVGFYHRVVRSDVGPESGVPEAVDGK